MPLNITGYVDPGAYQQEVVAPNGVAINSVQFAVGLIGVGSRSKRSINEAIIRGRVADELVTAATDELVNRAIKRQSLAVMTQDGVEMSQSAWQFNPAYIQTDGTTTFNLATKRILVLSLDGKAPIQIYFAINGTPTTRAVAVVKAAGTTNRFTATLSNNPAPALGTLTTADIVDMINATLAYATDAQLAPGLGYGTAYAAVASASGGRVVITSPRTDAYSDVAVWQNVTSTDDAAFGTTPPLAMDASTVAVSAERSRHAKTYVTITGHSALSTYKLTYVAVDTATDLIAQTGLSKSVRVGNYAGITNYTSGTDYTIDTNNNLYSWAGGSWTYAKILGVAGTYDLATTNKLSVSLDGKATITVDLSGAGNYPGSAAPASPAAATATEVVALINAALAANYNYGPSYAAAASVVSSAVQIQSPVKGQSGLVEISASSPSTADAATAIFGLASSQLPYNVRGVGQAPAAGMAYYVTYDYTRPTSEYNVAKSYLSPDAARADLGFESATNKLMTAVNLAFRNGAPMVYTVQVNDSTAAGSPTQLQLLAGLDAAGQSSSITEVVLLDTRSALRADLVQHCITQNGPEIQHPRRVWVGMPVGTVVGDIDTADSFIRVAAKELQVAADSPARGRFFLIAPATAKMDIVNEDGSESTITLDGAFLAAAAAGRYTSRSSPAEAMIGQSLLGFNYDTFPTFSRQERKQMASNGVFVLTAENNAIVMKDPLSTEAGGGRLPQFEEPSASSQKDNVVKNVNLSLESNVKNIVPTDLVDYIMAIKGAIGGVLEAAISSGAIGPFRDDAGRTRRINYATDIQVYQAANDPRKYYFRYFFMLRYPGKRFFGEYSVDNPFFTPGDTGLTA